VKPMKVVVEVDGGDDYKQVSGLRKFCDSHGRKPKYAIVFREMLNLLIQKETDFGMAEKYKKEMTMIRKKRHMSQI